MRIRSETGTMREETIVVKVIKEYLSALATNGAFNSAHEGWAVIKEEVDELWDEVKKKRKNRNINKMEKEATQIAAMAIRFIIDVCKKEG